MAKTEYFDVVIMETLTMYVIAIAAIFFVAVGFYLRLLRGRAEKIMPLPMVNPATRRKPRGLKNIRRK